MTDEAEKPAEKQELGHQEGSRWINRRPEGPEFASWFKQNVKLHEGLEGKAEKYASGVVLISAKEKLKVAKRNQAGAVVMVEEERLTYTPYAKVETRVAYWWDWLTLHLDDWLGIIEPVPAAQLGEAGVYNRNLPPGFFKMPVAQEDGTIATHVGCSMICRVYDRKTAQWVDQKLVEFAENGEKVSERVQQVLRGIPVYGFSAGTKMVNLLDRFGVEDPFALMKAETGAVGRALGMAGMLVIPGSGVSTAEDMQEAAAQGSGGSVDPSETAELPKPEQGRTPVDLGIEMEAAVLQLKSDFPETYEELVAWAVEKKIDLDEVKSTQKRAVLRQAERKLKEALTKAQDDGPGKDVAE